MIVYYIFDPSKTIYSPDDLHVMLCFEVIVIMPIDASSRLTDDRVSAFAPDPEYLGTLYVGCELSVP